VLRALEVLRQVDGIDPERISIAAQDEMASIALYAALLDGNVHSVVIKNPPATQNVRTEPDGRDPALEMLNCLRVTDVSHLPGLLYPTRVHILGDTPETYQWAFDLSETLQRPDAVNAINSMAVINEDRQKRNW